MQKKFSLLIIILCSGFASIGQSRIIKGYLKDSATHSPIALGKVINVTQKLRAVTDNNGFFSLLVNANDFIFASAPSYRYTTLSYSMLFLDTVTIYLANEGKVLPTVVVTSKYTKYQLDSMLRRTEFDEMRGTTYDAVAKDRGPGFGLTINLDRFFKKKYRDKKEQEKLFNQLERDEYVDYRFSPELVAMYTGLKGERLSAFRRKYNPGFAWLRQHPTNEDVLYYINDKLKEGKY